MLRHTYYWQNDVVYMRWMEDKRVVRVAKVHNGGCMALYPTSDKERFSFEAFREVDEPGMRVPGLEREGVGDEILLRLLDGKETREILRDYQPSPMGEESDGDNRFSYYFAKAGTEETGMDYHRHGTFHITDDMPERV